VDLAPDTPSTPLARYGSWPVVLGTLGGVLALVFALSTAYATARVALGGQASATVGPALFFVLVVVQDAIFLAAVYLLLVRRRVVTWSGLGLRRAGAGRAAAVGIGWGALFILVAGVLQYALAAFGVHQTQAAQFPLGGAGPWGTAAILAAGIAFAPITEEVFFRGFVFRAISERKGLVQGVVYSSMLFGAVHWNLAAFLPITAGAALLALGFHRTDHLLTPIVAHALNNAFAFAMLLIALNS
jgi:membrane protease YdiL (CAAX protease family)